jgi:hypothetical protein
MEQLQKAAYAVIGSGDLLLEKAKEFPGQARELPTKTRSFFEGRQQGAVKLYGQLAKRGETLFKSIARSKPVKRAADQTKQARSQIKGAVTSIGKAVGSQAEAAKSAADKVG